MDENTVRAYQKIIDGLNHLTSCSAVWMHQSLTYTSNNYEKKISAGADQLANRSRIQIGSSDSMPWVTCNFSIPTIKTGRQVNYFLPNGIFVFENRRIGHVPYDDLSVINISTQRFIEEEAVPSDAQIVGSSWRYANKDGGPDRRFSNNYEIPVCLYGRMELVSSSGLHWLIETSNPDAPIRFSETAISGARFLASIESPIIPVGTKYFGQSFVQFTSQLPVAIADYAKVAIPETRRLPARYDRLLRRLAGEGNDMVLWFLRVFIPTMFIGLFAAFVAAFLF